MPSRRDIFRAVAFLVAQRDAATRGAVTGAGTAAQRAPLPLGEAIVVGTRHGDAPHVAAALRPGQPLLLRREMTNRYDPWAVAVHTPEGHRLGYIPRGENRWIADLLDAGARIGAELPDGYPQEVTAGKWRITARLSLLDAVARAPPGTDAQEQAAHLLRAPPLLAERYTGPDYGARAVMLTGPCAGWQRTKAAEWVPPGSLPWPSATVIASEFRLCGGEYAHDQTAVALREAARLGLSVPDLPSGLAAPKPPPVARPSERPRTLYRGWLDALGRQMEEIERPFSPLDFLSLERHRGHRRGPWTMVVLDRNKQFVAVLPATIGKVAARLLDEGFNIDIVGRQPGPCARINGGIRVPFEIRLRGDDPPDVARRRAEFLLLASKILPDGWDAERTCGHLRFEALRQFVERAHPAAHQAGGQLSERQANALLAWAVRATGPA